jgi:hypothetical protein
MQDWLLGAKSDSVTLDFTLEASCTEMAIIGNQIMRISQEKQ